MMGTRSTARLAEKLWQEAARSRDAIVQWDEGKAMAAELNRQVELAAVARDVRNFARLDKIDRELAALQAEFELAYNVEILSGPDQQSGTERIWNDENGARTSGFYVFVEARDPKGHAVSVPIHSRETDRTESVSKWGEQVPEPVFDRLVADKKADGVLDEREFGVKRRGKRQFEVELKDADGKPLPRGGQITSW